MIPFVVSEIAVPVPVGVSVIFTPPNVAPLLEASVTSPPRNPFGTVNVKLAVVVVPEITKIGLGTETAGADPATVAVPEYWMPGVEVAGTLEIVYTPPTPDVPVTV